MDIASIRLTPTIANDGLLRCPYCGSEYLHHFQVTTYSRQEDAINVRRVAIQTNTQEHAGSFDVIAMIVPNSADNPSARRHGLVIAFFCEMCPGISELTIAQHKGVSEIKWRHAGTTLAGLTL
jgi:DNA-directed RNA polymerase subunit RPC12/RpoP